MMRPVYVFALVLFGLASLSSNAYAADACCAVVSVRPDPFEPGNGLVTARDTRTGRTFDFKVDARDRKGLKVGDTVDADLASGRITALSGVARSYAVLQPNAAAPCCDIVSIQPDPVEPVNEIVTARDGKTGRTFSFKADALDRNSLKVGDKVGADLASGKLTSLKGVSRAYAVFEPDAVDPCCAIASIQPDPAEPVNEIVTARDTKTGRTFQFSITAALENELKVGQAVGLNQTNNMAHVQSAATGAGGKRATYSYPVKGSAGCPEGLTAQWERVGGAPRKGQTGRLLVTLPEDANYIVNIFKGNVKVKQLMRLKLFDLIPGEYEVKISNAGVPNVPIVRGCDTRVRTGVLNVTLAAGQAWHVYDDAAKVRVESGRGPEKIGVLVGKYQMMIGKDVAPVEVRDQKTTDF